MRDEQIDKIKLLSDNISRVFIGKSEIVRLVIATLIGKGHLLIEDVPGIGKTLLGIALAKSIDASFKRIQFTNDLLPSDILGSSIFKSSDSSFEFRKGPIFSNIVLADEINRTTPKTQSALLEAMNDGRVTIDGNTLSLPELFMVIATQNPVEYHGTYPLPEAQLDRFFLRLKIGYPLPEHEKKIIHEKDLYDRAHKIDSVLSTKGVEELQKTVPEIRIDESLVDYILKIVDATRNSKSVKLGVSPRGTLLLARAAQAYAVTFGRAYVVPDDIKAVVVPVLSHRIVIDSNLYGFSRINESDGIINELVKKVPVPV